MSYDIRLKDKETGETLVAKFNPTREGTYSLSNSKCRPCRFNITYNYSGHYYRHIDSEKGIRAIYGKTARESIPILEAAISKLKGEADSDYWKGTEGNAREALRGLLEIARNADPDGVWDGD